MSEMIEEKEESEIELSGLDIEIVVADMREKGYVVLSVEEFDELVSRVEKLNSLPEKFSSLLNISKSADERLTKAISDLLEYGKLTEKRTYGMMEVVNLIQSFLSSFSPAQLMKPSFYNNNPHVKNIEESLKYLNGLFPTDAKG